MEHPVAGLHHVTATVDDAQEDLDFATGVLGFAWSRRPSTSTTISVYHFYYGDESGTPGTIWTTFPYTRPRRCRSERRGWARSRRRRSRFPPARSTSGAID